MNQILFSRIPSRLMNTLLVLWYAIIAFMVNAQGDFYLKETPVGIGVFAAKDLQPFGVMRKSIGIPIPLYLVVRNQLVNYVEGYNASHAVLSLGVGMLLNHAMDSNKVNVRKFTNTMDDATIIITYEYNAMIFKDEELLITYGDDDWFSDRNISWQKIEEAGYNDNAMTTIPPPPPGKTFDPKFIQPIPNFKPPRPLFADAHEWIEYRNRKLYAKKTLPRGMKIELVRVLLLPVTSSLMEMIAKPFLFSHALWLSTMEPRLVTIDTNTSPYFVPPYNISHSYAMVFSGLASFYSPSVITNISPNGSRHVLMDRANVFGSWESDSALSPRLRSTQSTVRLMQFTTKDIIEAGTELVLERYNLVSMVNQSRKIFSFLT